MHRLFHGFWKNLQPLWVNWWLFVRKPTAGTWYMPRWRKWQYLGALLIAEFFFTAIVVFPCLWLADKLLPPSNNRLEDYETLAFALGMYVLLAPFFEEIMFRYWLKWPAKHSSATGSKLLAWAVYASVVVFALLHLSIDQYVYWWHWMLAPMMVLSQFVGGFIISWLRLRFGFWYGMAYHGLWNGLMAVLLPVMLLWAKGDDKVYTKNYSFRLTENAFFQSGKPKTFKADIRDSMIYRLYIEQYTLCHVLDSLYGPNRWRVDDTFIDLLLQAPNGISHNELLLLLRQKFTIVSSNGRVDLEPIRVEKSR